MITTRIQVYDLDPAEPAYSAFVKCTMVVYGGHGAPSHSHWMVPGTLEGDVVPQSSGAVAVGYFSDFGSEPCVRFSDEIGRRYGAKGSIAEAGSTVCAAMRQPSDSFTIVPGTAQ